MLEIKPIDIPGADEHNPPGAGLAPGLSLDVFKYIAIAIQIMQTVAAGSGTFKTWTPLGSRWVTVSDKPPKP